MASNLGSSAFRKPGCCELALTDLHVVMDGNSAERLAMLWRRNLGPRGESLILKVKALSWSARFAPDTKRAMDREKICNAMKTLTPREREVMNGVVSGLLNKEIASDLGITVRTVKAHRGRVMAKMGAKSSAEFIKMLLTLQLNGKEQKANVQSMMSPENAGALMFIADLLQTTPEAFLEDLVFWHCRHEIDTRAIEYLAETIHAWMFPSRAAAQSAANKFKELTIRYNRETKPGGGFLYLCEVFAVPTDESTLELVIKGWQIHVEQFADGDWSPVHSLGLKASEARKSPPRCSVSPRLVAAEAQPNVPQTRY
jgi:DNA-binding CsgD family transcriptional regulator